MKISVKNIAFKASEVLLKELFEQFGEVSSAKIIIDNATKRSRGFGFVEIVDDDAGRAAINSLNGSQFLGKNLVVIEVK
jgi:RNA recognition motif-containing protein